MKLVGKLMIFFIICNSHTISASNQDWWKHTTVYEIFVWSFKDSNGDGIGDIKGITTKLDYFVELGIETLWLCPFFVSPMVDFGYDVSNYYDVDPRLGTLKDFDELVAEATKKGLKIMVDFVLNHSSDEHPWFLQSVERIEPYTDFYIWKDAKGYDKNGTPIPPNNWLSENGKSAWKWNAKRKQFYYSIFSVHQVDFNLRNAYLKNEILNIIKFWFDKGVYAARLDATGHYFEDAQFRDEEHPEWVKNATMNSRYFADSHHEYNFNQWESYQFVHDIRDFIDSHYNTKLEKRILIVECYTDWNHTMMYYGTDTYKIAHFPFNFNLIFTTHSLSPKTMDILIKSWTERVPEHGVANWQIGNHDYKRSITNLNPECMDVMIMMVMTLPGVACIYYGQEIGMTDSRVRPDQIHDFIGRDPARAPMQWDDSMNAGFSSNIEPWLPVNPNYYHVNVADEKKQEKTRYKLFKSLSNLRQTATLKYGDFTSYLVSKWVYAYVRSTMSPNDPRFIVIINFGSEEEMVHLPTGIPNLPTYLKVMAASLNAGYSPGETILTHPKFSHSFVMRPTSAVVLTT